VVGQSHPAQLQDTPRHDMLALPQIWW
jgi:hypothetical protein